VFALEQTRLGAGSAWVDLGAGHGKVVLLVALLSGARALGIELDARAVASAQAAAAALNLHNAGFVQGDVRTAPLPDADVYYMFMPFLGSAELVARLEPVARRRKLRLLCQTLDTSGLPWLRATGHRSYWLESYESAC
jgi:precorrin-6B methylase 2